MTKRSHPDTATGSRKTHSKSRNGCKTCKSRKIKCDEQKPACGNCIKHDVDCDFVTSGQQHVVKPGLSGELNMHDLELVNNFVTSTYATLSEDLIVREFYRTSAIRIGLGCGYIMRALLAISGQHMAYHKPDMRDHYRSVAAMHHRLATRDAMKEMNDVNSNNARNLFLFSSLTVFFALACPREDEGFLFVGESGFPEWMFLLQGTREFVKFVQQDGELGPLFQHGRARYHARKADPEMTLPAFQHLKELESLVNRHVQDEELKKIYAKAIDELRLAYSVYDEAVCGLRDMTDAFMWIFKVANDFLPLLRVPEQDAIAIFAFFSVLLKRLDNQWWLRGWSEHLMAKSYGLLDVEHRLWIRWPMAEVGWVP